MTKPPHTPPAAERSSAKLHASHVVVANQLDPVALAQRLEIGIMGLESLGVRRERIYSVRPYGGAIDIGCIPYFLHVVSLSGIPSAYEVTAALSHALYLPPSELRFDLMNFYQTPEVWQKFRVVIVLAPGFPQKDDHNLEYALRELIGQHKDEQWLVIGSSQQHRHLPHLSDVEQPTDPFASEAENAQP